MPKNKPLEQNFEWNSEIAYAVGLITTDGSLSKDGRHIVLVSTDYLILKNFQKCLPFLTKITDKLPSEFSKKKVYKIQFSNVRFYRWLNKIGLHPNKTYSIAILEIPDKYFRDFLRGHLDGDGDVVTYSDSYNTFKNQKYIYMRLYTRFCSASKTHIFWLKESINKLIKINGSINNWTRKDRTVPQWRLRFAKKNSIILFKWMYYSPYVLCLPRKRNKFENFLLSQKIAELS